MGNVYEVLGQLFVKILASDFQANRAKGMNSISTRCPQLSIFQGIRLAPRSREGKRTVGVSVALSPNVIGCKCSMFILCKNLIGWEKCRCSGNQQNQGKI